jgi:2-iminobutanoate/2-iminopropanoate deaminase
MKETIYTDKAPQPIGPYSQAIMAKGKFIFCSGQIPLTPEGTLNGDNIETQTHQAIQNIKAILEEANCTLAHVVKTLVMLADINDFPAMNKVYEEYFGASKPARGVFQAVKLPKNALIEIEAVAVVEE